MTGARAGGSTPRSRRCSTRSRPSTSPTSPTAREKRAELAARAPRWPRPPPRARRGPVPLAGRATRTSGAGARARRGVDRRGPALGARGRSRARCGRAGRPLARPSSRRPAASRSPSTGDVRPSTRTRPPSHDCYAALRWMADRPGLDPTRLVGRRRELGRWSWRPVSPCWPATAPRCRSPGSCSSTRCSTTGRSPCPAATVPDPRLWNHESNRLGWAAYLGTLAGDEVPAYAAPARATELRGLPPDLDRDRRARPLPRRGHRVRRPPARRGSPHRAACVPRRACTASTCSPRRRRSPGASPDRDEASTGSSESAGRSRG